MATGCNRFGLIILGNSGVGKSFIANILLGRDAFVHKSTVTAVTTETECHEVTFFGFKYAIFNIPGLIEASQDKINKNKIEIGKAFTQCPNAVIIYVFGNQNGRLRHEDLIAFEALNKAYPFKNKSLVLVVNCITSDSRNEEDYEEKTIIKIKELLTFKDWENICFLDDIRHENQDVGKQKLREQLLPSVLESMPNVHVKKQEIYLEHDKLQHLRDEYTNLENMFEQEKNKSREAIQNAQTLIHSTKEKYRREKKKRRRAVEDIKQQYEADARQQEQRPNETDARNSTAWERGLATATAAGMATAPLGPLVAGLSAAGGFIAGYMASD